jgi:membrane fusion protein (multidrug efflux system)
VVPRGHRLSRLLWLGGLLALAGLAIFLAYPWWSYRQTHSITEDAFVEAHIINVAPQTVSGHIVRFLVEENDRVKKGDPLVRIDPKPFQVQVNVKRAAVEVAIGDLAAAESQARGLEALARSQRWKIQTTAEQVNNQIALLKARVATLRTREATLDRARADYERAKKLLGQSAMSREDFDQHLQDFRVAEAAVNQAREEVYQVRASLGLALQPEKGKELTDVPPDLDETYSDVRTALAQLLQTSAQLGLPLASTNTTPKKVMEELRRLDKEGDLDRIFRDLVPKVPAVIQAKAKLEQARHDLDQAVLNLGYTRLRAPFPGVVVKRYLHLGDFASPGVAILSMYNPDLTYVTANLEEDRLPGVAPGNPVELQVDAFAEPFRGHVVWINQSTGAQFALMPRNVVSGEFTKVVQRVEVRIQIEQDERWPLLRAGLSVRAIIAHGPGDPQWAEQAAREMRDLETRYNQPQPPDEGADPGDHP